MRSRAFTVVLVVAALACAGCAMTPPRPWEKGDLARSSMQFGERTDNDRSEHVYASKEMATGGQGVGGGGCGCN